MFLDQIKKQPDRIVKTFAKKVMKEAEVPTAKYLPFTSNMLEQQRIT